MIGNGVLAGLVAITAPCGAVTPLARSSSARSAASSSSSRCCSSTAIRIDDPVGAISVHGVVGAWGLLSIGLFAKYDDAFLGREDAGLFYGGGLEQLAMQAVMLVIIAAWVAVTTGALFALVKATIGLRVSAEEEIEGLDVIEHGMAGYTADMANV